MQFTAGGVELGPTARTSYQPDATAALSGDLPINAIANLSANYHNNNLVGVHTTGVYLATDNQYTWQYKSGTTWRQGATLSPGSVSGSAAFTIDGTISDTTGNVRDIITVLRNSTTAFSAADAGKLIYKNNTTAYTWAVNTSVWRNGLAISVRNSGSSGDITISQGSGMTLRHGTTTGNFTLLPGEARTLVGISTTEVVIL